VNFPGTTQRSAQHQQGMHSAHTTAYAVTRRVHVASFHAFLFLLLPVSSLFLFPKPTLLGFYAPKGSRIYFGFEIGVPCFLRVMKNYDFKCECT
jgi:hypothetical protein